jgi:hypothetical protein
VTAQLKVAPQNIDQLLHPIACIISSIAQPRKEKGAGGKTNVAALRGFSSC